MRLTLRHFELVEALNTHGNFTLAARSLGLSQPAVSHTLKALEEQIGGKLFESSEKGIKATPLAEIFIRRHQSLKEPLEEILSDIKNLKNATSGRVLIGTGMYAPSLSVYSAMAQSHQINSAVTFEIIERDWREIMLALLSGRIDIGIVDVSVAEHNSQLAFERLPTHSCGIFVRKDHPLVGKRSVTVDDLVNYPYCGTFPSRWALEKAGPHRVIFGTKQTGSDHVNVPFALHTLGAVQQFILTSNAFGLMPRILAHRNELKALYDGLTLLDIPELNWLRTNYGMIWRRTRPIGPALAAFMAQVRTCEALLVEEEAGLAIPPPPRLTTIR